MNRAERRAEARKTVKGREARRAAARAMKSGLEIAQREPDPTPNLRASGFVIAAPKLRLPGQEPRRG